jgi:hypothetical protein
LASPGPARTPHRAPIERYGYALIVDKAQGSQWNDALLFDESFAYPQAPGAPALHRARSGGEALLRPRSVGVGIWIGRAWKERARQVHDVAEGARHSVGEPLLNRRRRRGCDGGRIAGALRGRRRDLRSARRRRLRRTPLSVSDRRC